ncbi:MAG: hypothetical protein IKJ74_04420 [Clostridia bacterium]|nr:hypothetical protein [Clostridia bacterium]
MKKQTDLFKPTPAGFHTALEDALAEAQAPKAKKRVPILVPGVAVAALLLLVLTPVMFPNVLGTKDEPSLVPETIGKYAFDLNLVQPGQSETAEPANKGPEFVKLVVTPIEGYRDRAEYEAELYPETPWDPRADDIKWYPVDNPSANGYSFFLSRPENKELYTMVGSYQKTNIGGHEAIIIEPAGSYHLRRVLMMYEDVNIVVTCYVNMKIPMEDMIRALEGISVIEGTPENNTPFSTEYKAESFPASPAENPYLTVIGKDLIFKEIGEEFTRNESITAKMESLEVLDNVKDLVPNEFLGYGYNYETESWLEYSDYVDAEGKLYPRISDVWIPGDRVNTVDLFVESNPYEQKYILFRVTYTNHTDEDVDASTGFELNFYDTDEKGKLIKSMALLNDRNADRDEFMYLSRNADGATGKQRRKGITLKAGETKTITIGYRCDERLLDQAYLTCKNGHDHTMELSTFKVTK